MNIYIFIYKYIYYYFISYLLFIYIYIYIYYIYIFHKLIYICTLYKLVSANCIACVDYFMIADYNNIFIDRHIDVDTDI